MKDIDDSKLEEVCAKWCDPLHDREYHPDVVATRSFFWNLELTDVGKTPTKAVPRSLIQDKGTFYKICKILAKEGFWVDYVQHPVSRDRLGCKNYIEGIKARVTIGKSVDDTDSFGEHVTNDVEISVQSNDLNRAILCAVYQLSVWHNIDRENLT